MPEAKDKSIENAPSWAIDLVENVKFEHFPELAKARFLVMYDSQKRTSLGRVQYGTMRRASSMINALAEDEYDYVFVINKKLFEAMQDANKEKLVFHFLCHCDVVTEDEETAYKLRGPDVRAFDKEMQEFKNGGWLKFQKSLGPFAAQIFEKSEPSLPLEGEEEAA